MVNPSEASIHVQPIYILKASFLPIYCQRRMASLFSLHIKKKSGWQGLRRMRKAWRKEKKWYDRCWGEDGWGSLFPSNKCLTKYIPHSCPFWKTNFDHRCPLKWSEEKAGHLRKGQGVCKKGRKHHNSYHVGEGSPGTNANGKLKKGEWGLTQNWGVGSCGLLAEWVDVDTPGEILASL